MVHRTWGQGYGATNEIRAWDKGMGKEWDKDMLHRTRGKGMGQGQGHGTRAHGKGMKRGQGHAVIMSILVCTFKGHFWPPLAPPGQGQGGAMAPWPPCSGASAQKQ